MDDLACFFSADTPCEETSHGVPAIVIHRLPREKLWVKHRCDAHPGRRRSFTRMPRASLVFGPVAQLALASCAAIVQAGPLPGTAYGCWDAEGDFTHRRCCVENDDTCWEDSDDPLQRRVMCCSGLLAAQAAATGEENDDEAPLNFVTALPGAPQSLVDCVRGGSNITSPRWHAVAGMRGPTRISSDLVRNNFNRAAACLARTSGMDVILDLFLGGGFTSSRLARSVASRVRARAASVSIDRYKSSRTQRMPEMFSFDDDATLVQRTADPDGRLGVYRPLVMPMKSTEDVLTLQRRLLQSESDTSTARYPLAVWLFAGRPVFQTERDIDRYWGPLDVLCQNRAPIDLVVIDTTMRTSVELEWLIIEAVCRPRWVLLHNTNLFGGGGWIMNRLLMMHTSWRLVLHGYYSQHHKQWSALSELKRVRSWAIFSRTDA
eukprot:TRINITY_DN27346_c0_g1_i1.p1 TRINITY_DN27346_c0_g1~~TRINITY_DN27346_c0_g1_i1.p1  ORF type:complete len:446 (-),score=40.41 TRINITY_DN27346_c0_g1_i1:31-1332(-)